jgi:hypothetical protein
VKEFIEGEVVAIRDDALQIVTEVLDVEELGTVDLPLDDDVAEAVLDLYEGEEADDVLDRPVDLALTDQLDLLAETEDVVAV